MILRRLFGLLLVGIAISIVAHASSLLTVLVGCAIGVLGLIRLLGATEPPGPSSQEVPRVGRPVDENEGRNTNGYHYPREEEAGR